MWRKFDTIDLKYLTKNCGCTCPPVNVVMLMKFLTGKLLENIKISFCQNFVLYVITPSLVKMYIQYSYAFGN